jgi:hypothetical protein
MIFLRLFKVVTNAKLGFIIIPVYAIPQIKTAASIGHALADSLIIHIIFYLRYAS